MNKALDWKDITSYRKGEANRVPRILECRLSEGVIFKVHKHVWFDDEWLLSCDYLGLGMVQLGTCDLDEAKAKAIKIMVQKLEEECGKIQSFLTFLQAACYS